MSRKKKQSSSFDVAKRLQRKLSIQQGYYDGRYKEKVVPDKKKKESRALARRKFRPSDLD